VRKRLNQHCSTKPGRVRPPPLFARKGPWNCHVASNLVNTGIQRLVQDLDELPLPFDALGSFEPPHRRPTLSAEPIPAARLGRHAHSMGIITTHGCKFHCPYCPIPGFNQYTFRHRSPDRLVE
jgi:radical SAM superfamily enzyme YgiQ (UPF0313 family)